MDETVPKLEFPGRNILYYGNNHQLLFVFKRNQLFKDPLSEAEFQVQCYALLREERVHIQSCHR